MKILFASRYVDPQIINENKSIFNGNKNVFLQAQSLIRSFGINVEILTWPQDDAWAGPLPPVSNEPNLLTIERAGIPYHVFRAPSTYDIPAGGAELSEDNWEKAVEYGMYLLIKLKPDIVHLQHRHGLWWILESAQRLDIATVYSNHDWGIPCMRTVLVTGNNQLCDGVVESSKCATCIRSGRRSRLGRMNEKLVDIAAGELLAGLAAGLPILGDALRSRGFVTQRVEKRTLIHQQRATRVIKRLSHCFTPSNFGAKFFSQFGCPKNRISVLPWYHDPVNKTKKLKLDQPFTISYIGRVSPEKGVDFIFHALEKLIDCEPILLKIVGENDGNYCKALKQQYPLSVGIHAVEWLGWSKVEPLFQTTDVTIIPSQWMDNTPLSLIEALAYQTPVIATRVPPIEEFLVEGETGFFADYGSVESLADAIIRALKSKALIRKCSYKFPKVHQLDEYMKKVVNVYRSILIPVTKDEF